jgi:membrane-associated protein
MPFRAYTAYNVLGAVLWIWSMLFVGYFLGRFIPGIENHITKVILVVIFISLLPGLISWQRERTRASADAKSRVVS